MRADLDELFAAFGAHADVTASGTPEAARRRGQQRRRNRLTSAILVLVLLVSVAVIGGIQLTRGVAPTQPSPQPSGSLATLTPVGSLPMPLTRTPGQFDGGGIAAVVGDRAYLAGDSAGGGVKVGSMDLVTGEPVFATVDIETWTIAVAFWASPQGLALLVGRDGDAARNLIVLDPDIGTIRWQTSAEDPIAFYDSVLVTTSANESVVRARDWTTGSEKWQAPYAGDYPPFIQALAPPLTSDLKIGNGWSVDPTDHRLLRPDADGTVHIIDARTGAELAVRQGIAETASNRPAHVAYGATLYTIDQEAPSRVLRHDLDGTEVPTELYTSTGERVDAAAPCGTGRLCLVVSLGFGKELVVIDEASQREVWRSLVVEAIEPEIQSVGDRILIRQGDLFTLDGQQLAPGNSLGFHAWVSPGSALVVTRAEPGEASPLAIGIMSTVDGSITFVGQIPPSVGPCGWNNRVLVCPAADGFHAWRFASD